jgi:hypothetical protein
MKPLDMDADGIYLMDTCSWDEVSEELKKGVEKGLYIVDEPSEENDV